MAELGLTICLEGWAKTQSRECVYAVVASLKRRRPRLGRQKKGHIVLEIVKGSEIRLVGKTHKGKQRVKTDGDLWTVIEVRENVPACDGGRGLLIQNNKKSRWIHASNDPDFWIELKLGQ